MSDDQGVAPNAGRDARLPELDDHRQAITVPQPRRSTLNSSNRTRLLDTDRNGSTARSCSPEGDEMRDDAPHVRPGGNASQRSTIASSKRRPASPKDSAEARRREQSTSEPADIEERDGGTWGNEEGLIHTTSLGSDRWCRGRPRVADRNAASLATNRSAEGDVCRPVQKQHLRDRLHIDFDYLETLMTLEKPEQSARNVFSSLQSRSTPQHGLSVATADGDFINIRFEKATLANQEEEAAQRLADARQVRTDPNRFSFFSSTLGSTIHAAELSDLVSPGKDVRSLFSFPKGELDGVWWLNMNNPTGEEVRTICVAFGIHPLTIEDIRTQESHEKIELFQSYYFACFRSFKRVEKTDGVNYTPFNVYVMVFREGTISFSFVPNAHASHVQSRISMLKEHVLLSSDWICYALIDDIVDSFAPPIDRIGRETGTIEDQVFNARPNDIQEFNRKIGTARKNIMSLMRLLGGKADVLRAFTKRCNEDYNVTPRMDIGLFLSDIQDHVVTMINNLSHFEKILAHSHSNYLNQLSIDNLGQGNRANEFLRHVTVVTTVILAMTVISGLFGMNVLVPWQDLDNVYAFLGIASAATLFALICLLAARGRRFI
ncbi:hypothetical protein B0J13DRAFT_573356 [Dactylonectria estremocensis]|uniref:Uncharacterized protein n=1 Tax=Dactylonectria estremocensis TaxID=1079267 RepID=A0A9P9D8V1_9HYPO|nr:hypothetical protein B0J13DRAFT_573356 [Dactylonectria estremocensis]